MYSSPHTIKAIFSAAVAAILVTVLSVGFSVIPTITPESPSNLIQGVSRDGWIMQGGEIRFEGLLQAGNRLALALNPWRPPGVPEAQLSVSVCGERVAEFVVAKSTPYFIPLDGVCEPRTVLFEVANPFVAGQGDTRLLGVQLIRAKVTSLLGVPLPKITTILLFAAGIFLPALLLLLGPIGAVTQLSAFLLIVTAGWLLLGSSWRLDGDNLTALWVLTCLLSFGICCASRHGHQAEGRNQAPGFDPHAPRDLTIGLLATALTIVSIGGILRFYGISFGLPAPFHPDETPKVNALMAMDAAGSLNPKYFLHPSFLLYLTYFLGKALTVVLPDWGQDSLFRLAGRLVSATAGTLSIAFLFGIGRRLYGPFVGIVAAALLAIAPLNVTCSRYLKEDSLMTLWLMVVAYLVVRAVQDRTPKLLPWAGLCAGFAAGTKYSGILVAGLVALSPWLRSRSFKPDPAFLRAAIIGGFLVIFGFVLVTPFAVLDFPTFAKGIMSEKKHMERGHTFPITASSQYWMYHLRLSVVPGLTILPTFIALLGAGLLLWRRRVEDLFILGIILLFYLPAEWVRAKPAPQPERYMVPCIPFLAIAAGEFVRVAANSRFRHGMAAVVALMVCLPASRTLLLAREVRSDTRELMAQWIDAHVPPGSTILIDYPPYDPPISPTKFNVVRFPPGELMKRLTVESLREDPADYVVLSSLVYDRFFSQPNESGIRRAIIRRVFRDVPILQQFRPRHGTYGFHNPTVTLFSLAKRDFQELAHEQQLVRSGELEFTANEARASLKVESHHCPNGGMKGKPADRDE